MLSLLSLRLASRRVLPLAVAVARPVARPLATSVFQSHTLTRSFLTSAFRAEPSTTTAEKSKSPKPKTKPKSKSKSSTGVKRDAKPKKKPEDKPKKKPAKPRRVIVPRDLKIPPHGPGDFMYFISAYYNVNLPKVTREDISLRSKEAAEAWSALPVDEKQRISAEAREVRDKLRAERNAFLESMDPKIFGEINRRRVAKGKSRIVLRRDSEKRPSNQFVIFSNDYRKEHPELRHQPATALTKKIAEVWNNMSAAEKEPWVTRARQGYDEWRDARERQKTAV